MAITKDVQTTAIEVAGEYKIISVKKTTTILEDGVEISKNNHRTTHTPDTDVSTLDADVASIANVSWTDEIKTSFQTYIDSIPAPILPSE